MKTKYLEIKKSIYSGFRFTITSGDGEEHEGCSLKIAGFGYWFSLSLPAIIKPKSTKEYPSWDQATIDRLGRNYYYHYDEREYGISLYDGHMSIYYGIQTNSSNDTKQWGYFLPWTQHTFVRRTIFNADGTFYANFPSSNSGKLGSNWDKEYEATQTVHKDYYSFLDYDFEEIVVAVFIEEREWHKGEKWCSWLKYFNKPMIRKSLDLHFYSEVGPRKGSWKGGTTGHSIEMLEGEEALDAFLRYCDQNKLRFVDFAEQPEPIKIDVPVPKLASNPDFGVIDSGANLRIS